ncbi:MAG: hypothetical protein HY922_03570 [Elusimicrobia bacterium]|nr:hypothetical protein [Elusimicrobiota bacterium]
MADRFGRKRVMAWTILIYSLSTGLCGLSTGRAGVSEGIGLAAGFALISAAWVWTFPETRGIVLRQE